MDRESFRKFGHELIDWIADYYRDIESYPVKSQSKPGDIYSRLPENAPEKGEPFDSIMEDFQKIIMPGITHWQHPNFHAYFPANSSFPSLLGEILTSALAAQCMVWETSPAAAELEEMTMNWLREMLALPNAFTGVIQDTASTATLCAVLTARENISDYQINEKGFGSEKYRVYCSSEAHSSIEKAAKIAGIGKENVVKIPVDRDFAMIPKMLEKQIAKDINAGFHPLCVVAALGTTGSTAVDPIGSIGDICSKNNIWLHIDAALAGSALILPEMRHFARGLEKADSFVFNPHKWMFTNFDCSAYFVKDKAALIRTFEILPEYLKTEMDNHVNNYRDWGIPLGRRFRALKLWFVLRSFGKEGLQTIIGNHIKWTKELGDKIKMHANFEILAPYPFNTVCFRYAPLGVDDGKLDELNSRLLSKLNNSGKIYLTHTKLDGKYTIRFVVGQTYTEKRHIDSAWQLICDYTKSLS